MFFFSSSSSSSSSSSVDTNYYTKKSSNSSFRFLLLRYEQLNDIEHLKQLFHFFGMNKISESLIKEEIEATSFQNMRELEMSGEGSKKIRPKDETNIDTFKTRESKSGNFVYYFSSNDLYWMKQKMNEILPPELSYE